MSAKLGSHAHRRSLAAAVLGVSLLASTPAFSQAPSTWVATHRPGRLWVPHPDDWQFSERAGGGFLVRRGIAPEASFVLVQPLRMAGDEDAAEELARLARREPDLLGDVQTARLPWPLRPGVSVWTLASRSGERRRVGRAVAVRSGENGVLYAIAAEDVAWPRDAETMSRILQHFRFLPPSAPGGASIDLVDWRDSREGAFTLPVPRGWEVQGGLMRPNPLLHRPEVVVSSPDAEIQIRIGDASVPVFGVPYGIPGVGVIAEGTVTAGQTVLWRYLPGARFLTEFYLPRKFAAMRDVTVEDRPDWAAGAYASGPPAPPMQGRADAGAVRFAVDLPIGPRVATYAAITRYQEVPGLAASQAWYLEVPGPVGALYVVEREAEALRLAAAMLSGFAWNEDWLARQSEANAQLARRTAEHTREMNELTARGLANAAIGRDEAGEVIARGARGEIALRDADTGERVLVPQTGSQDYYRVHATGEIVAADEALPPFDFRLLLRSPE